MIDSIQKKLLKEIAGLDGLPVGAYNIRANGAAAGRNTTANIDIITKTDKPGIDIIIALGTVPELCALAGKDGFEAAFVALVKGEKQ